MSTDMSPLLLSFDDETDYGNAQHCREDFHSSLSSSTVSSSDCKSDCDCRSDFSQRLRRVKKLIKRLTSTVKMLNHAYPDSKDGNAEASFDFGFGNKSFYKCGGCCVIKAVAPATLWTCDDTVWLLLLIVTHVVVLSLGVYMGQSSTVEPTADILDIVPHLQRLDESVAAIRTDISEMSNAVSPTALISTSLGFQNVTSFTYTIAGWRVTLLPTLPFLCALAIAVSLAILFVLSFVKLILELCFGRLCTICSVPFGDIEEEDNKAVTVGREFTTNSESFSSKVRESTPSEESRSCEGISAEGVVENNENSVTHENKEEMHSALVMSAAEPEDRLSERYDSSFSDESEESSSEEESTDDESIDVMSKANSNSLRRVEVESATAFVPSMARLQMQLNKVDGNSHDDFAMKINALFNDATFNVVIRNDSNLPRLFKLRVTNVENYTAQPPFGRIDGCSSTTVVLKRKSVTTASTDKLIFEFIELTSNDERCMTSEEISKRFKCGVAPHYEAVLSLSVLPNPNV